MNNLTFEEYQDGANETAIYPGRHRVQGLLYTVLGLAGETGEIAEKVKKILRDSDGIFSEDDRVAISKELGDVLWYLSQIATELDVSLADVAQMNYEKLKGRQDRGTLQGSGDDR